MGGRDDDPDASEVTIKAPSFVDELRRPDLWRETTPVDDDKGEADAPIDAEYSVEDEEPPLVVPAEAADNELAGAAWEEAEEVLEGDGPFAVPVDEAPSIAGSHPAADLMAEAFGHAYRPAAGPGVLGHTPRTLNLESPREFTVDPGIDSARSSHPVGITPPGAPDSYVLERRKNARPSQDHAPGRSSTGGRRRYPLMLARLKDPTVARRPGRRAPDRPPPVPGTFFPAPREPQKRPDVNDLDKMLLTMAEGLLIGQTPEGHTEVRVTLKDEFFAGTELRVATSDGKVRAVLAPPDRQVYWQLNGSLDELRERLGARGLQVTDIELLEP